MKPILIAKNGTWKQHPSQKAAERYFESMTTQDIWDMADQLVLGAFDKMDWFDEKKDGIFIRHLTDLVMEANEV
ncbi:MAG: hypothetical protein P8Y00_00355 [Deltaproteobacteria bacterium]